MMGNRITLNGPIRASMEIWCLVDGDHEAKITFSFGYGKFPTPADIEAGIEKAFAQVKEQFGDVRKMTKREFFDAVMQELTGSDERFAMDGHETEWDKPE